MNQPHFYLVIIGTEILNGRRNDAHFSFVKDLLLKNHISLFASFIIEDDAVLIENTFTLIKNDPDSILFSFGGIGSTPDDLTREIAAKVFTRQPLVHHEQFSRDIIEKFGDAAYPHRIQMSMLPQGSSLLFNPVNNMSGFQLDERFFFVPGFPQMSHPMIKEAVERYFSHFHPLHRRTLSASCSEERLITLMKTLPSQISLSSLPQFIDNKPHVVLSLSANEKDSLDSYFEKFIAFLKAENIPYSIGDTLK